MSKVQNSNILSEDVEISLIELFKKLKYWYLYLHSKLIIIVIVGLVGGSIGFFNALFQKPIYTATLIFAEEDEKSTGRSVSLSSSMGLANSLGIDLDTKAGGAFTPSNLIELMKSRTIVERALLNSVKIDDKLISLADYFQDFTGTKELLKKKPTLTHIKYEIKDNRSSFSIQKDSLLGDIYQKIVGENVDGLLSISQKDKTSIIRVEVKSENELFSKEFTESIIKEVSQFYIESKSKKARANVAILQKQTDSIRNELDLAIHGVAEFSDNTFNLNAALNVKTIPSTRRQFDVQANTTILTQLVTNLEIAKVNLLKETPLIQIIDSPILPLKKEVKNKINNFILGDMLATLIIVSLLIL